MSTYRIDPLLVATQGAFASVSFAPFAFSPIAFAIQGLIKQLQEALRQVYGSGRGARAGYVPPKSPTRREPKPAPRPSAPVQRDDAALTPEIVEAQWELLETKRATEAPRSTSEISIPANATAEQARALLRAAGLDDENDIVALLVLLALA